ncbi:hypothetical protein [Falsihalocynthiibacter sp. CO-5D18]|uniref:winged helix domain-containing protein n=1 Tax=Falsihalocynthiibacter sp. CO-5D18 TaxID=3240872 RepID=UPI00350FC5E8
MSNSKAWGARAFRVTNENSHSKKITIQGRERWALSELIASGELGCTPIDNPAPRWSAYVHSLRKLGVDIETITEAHNGPFKGTHARYVLTSDVRPWGDV